MDRIEIRGLRLRCIIGFNPEERREKQDVVIDMTLFTEMRHVGISDNPDDVLNYRTINKAVIKHVEASSYNTLEALAVSIARLVIVEHGVQIMHVTVHKPGALRFADSVSVSVERTMSDFQGP